MSHVCSAKDRTAKWETDRRTPAYHVRAAASDEQTSVKSISQSSKCVPHCRMASRLKGPDYEHGTNERREERNGVGRVGLECVHRTGTGSGS